MKEQWWFISLCMNLKARVEYWHPRQTQERWHNLLDLNPSEKQQVPQQQSAQEPEIKHNKLI